MIRTKHYASTSALPAIAAALALCSTPAIAQQAQPTEPAPVTTQSTPPIVDTTPVTTTDTPPVASDPSATTSVSTAATSQAKPTHTRTVTRTTRTSVAKPAVVATRTVTTRTATARASVPVAAPPTATTAAPTAPATQSTVTPVVDLNAQPPPAPAQTAAHSGGLGKNELMLGGGALALLALGGAAYAVSRRRRREDEWVDEESVHEPAMEQEPAIAAPAEAEPLHDPIFDEQPAIVAPSAFAWEGTAPAEPRARGDADDDRLPGETWIERAYRGPSANNPSVSLKNRLGRAAFFDKRERDVAAGIAEPVDADAGLPDSIAEQPERELT